MAPKEVVGEHPAVKIALAARDAIQSPECHDAVPKRPLQPLFVHLPDDQLLGYGVPVEWLNDVKAADEDSLLDLELRPKSTLT